MADGFPTDGELRPGATFAGLQIERELGRGGSGVVYLARDTALDRAVALKVLHRHAMGDDPASLERFRNEAQIAAKLEHPAIIPIYSTGVDRGQTYLVMRYVPGRSLATYLNDHAPMPAGEAISLLRPVAVALDYAAEFAIVHRDVKPANVFVDESFSPPRTLLGDFGIARAYEGTRHTATGGWVGTPDYIAPEVLKDEQATARADQYSLACVLVECISGVSPFKRSNTAATITAQVTETPDLETLPNLTPRVAEALAVALEKNPHDRYESCTQFLDALAASLTASAESTPATIVRRRKRSKVKRHVKIAATVAATVLGLLLGIAQVSGFNAREWLDGGGGATSGTAGAVTPDAAGGAQPAAASAPRPDVLILGSDLANDWSAWKTKPGVSLPDVVENALTANVATADYTVKSVPLHASNNCAEDVKRAAASMPTKAVVVLESPCDAQVVRVFGARSIESPPIFVLWSRWISTDVALAFLPDGMQGGSEPLTSVYGDIDRRRFVPVQLPFRDFFTAGQVAHHYGRSRCTILMPANGFNYPVAAATFAGLRGTDTQTDASINQATWQSGSVDQNFVARETRASDCIMFWGAEATGSDTTAASLRRQIRQAVAQSPEKLFMTLDSDPFESSWELRHPNLLWVDSNSWIPAGIPQDRFHDAASTTFRAWDKEVLYDDRAALLYVADLIAGISKAHANGYVDSSEWISKADAGSGKSNDGTTFAWRDSVADVAPTDWGFVSGFEATVSNARGTYDYVGGTSAPDLSGAPGITSDATQ